MRKRKRQEKRKNKNKNKKDSKLEYVDIEEEITSELDDIDYDVEDKSFDRNVHRILKNKYFKRLSKISSTFNNRYFDREKFVVTY